MTRAEKKHHQKISKKCLACLRLSLGLVLVLGLAKMVLTNRASTWGHDLYSIKKQTDQLKKENLSLETELVKLSGGLDQISLKAKELGFTDKPKIKYFTKGSSVAQVLP